MESFSLKPKPGDMERWRRRVEEQRVWWVEFDPMVEALYCTGRERSVVYAADDGIAWTGLDTRHHPRAVATDQPDVWRMDFGIPVERMAVPHELMRDWMRIVRDNHAHGRYREAGTKTTYEF